MTNDEKYREGVPAAAAAARRAAVAASASVLSERLARTIGERAGELLGGGHVRRLADSLAEAHQGVAAEVMRAASGVDFGKLVGVEPGSSSFVAAIDAMQPARSILDQVGIRPGFDVTKLAGIESIAGPAGAAAAKPWMTTAAALVDGRNVGPVADIAKITGAAQAVAGSAIFRAATAAMESAQSMLGQMAAGRRIDDVVKPWMTAAQITGMDAVGGSSFAAATGAMKSAQSMLGQMAAGRRIDHVVKPWMTAAASLIDPLRPGPLFAAEKLAGVEPQFRPAASAVDAIRSVGAQALAAWHVPGSAFRWSDLQMGPRVPAGFAGLVSGGLVGELAGIGLPHPSPWLLRDVMWAGPDHVSAVNGWMRQAQASLADTVWRWSMPDHAAWMERVMRGPADALAEALRSWSSLAGRGVWQAQVALSAALRAVSAIRRGDRDAVRAFLHRWLRFQFVSWDLVTSATLVLLDLPRWLPPSGVVEGYDPCDRLRRLTLVEHRCAKRLSTDPHLRLCGGPVRSLSEPVPVAHDVTKPLVELLPDRAAPEPTVLDEDDITDPRVLRVWWKLTDREREILREKGRERMTWPAAAVACGGSPADGERLRRKVERLSAPSTQIRSAGRATG